MGASDWYARKLGEQRPAQPQQPTPPASHPGYAPPPMGGHGPTSEATPTINTTADVIAGAGAWKGGQGTKTETTKCPACGSTNYFSRSNAPGVMNANTGQTVKPNPMCLGCGYNGREDWTQTSINQGGGA